MLPVPKSLRDRFLEEESFHLQRVRARTRGQIVDIGHPLFGEPKLATATWSVRSVIVKIGGAIDGAESRADWQVFAASSDDSENLPHRLGVPDVITKPNPTKRQAHLCSSDSSMWIASHAQIFHN